MRTNKELNWYYVKYTNDSWKSKVFQIEHKLYLLKSYSDLYDIVKYKDTDNVKSAKRNLTLYEVNVSNINMALVDSKEFDNRAGIIERVGTSMSTSVKKSFDGYVDGGRVVMATELDPTYDRRKYSYNVVDSGEILININNRKVLANIKTGELKFYRDNNTTKYSSIRLGDFLKSYTGNIRIIDIFEVPGRKTISGPYIKKVPQVIYEGTLNSNDLGFDILDKSILDKLIKSVSLNTKVLYSESPVLEIILE